MSPYSNISTTAISSSTTSSAAAGGGSVTELKLYQAFIFSVPVFFTFILLFLFYLFYLRPRRVDWDSLRMRTSSQDANLDELSRAELGLKKEVREMLPIIVYKESFSVKDTQCPVCLADYQAEDRLQQIPACGHTFHMDCIDHWLTNHTTCPLCRLSLLVSSKTPRGSTGNEGSEGGAESSVLGSSDGIPVQQADHAHEGSEAVEHFDSTNGNFRAGPNNCGTEDSMTKTGVVGCNSLVHQNASDTAS